MIKPYLVCKNDTNKQEREFRKITKMKHYNFGPLGNISLYIDFSNLQTLGGHIMNKIHPSISTLHSDGL